MESKIKIGCQDLWENFNPNWLKEVLFYPIQDKIEIVDYKKEICDAIVISSLRHYSLNYKGNPLIIYVSGELNANFKTETRYDFSLTFQPNSNTNLYFPYWWWIVLGNKYTFQRQNNINKTKFCTFIARNGGYAGNIVKERMNVAQELSKYKRVDCCGRCLNNMNGFLLPRDMKSAIDFHKDYKFNLCFENSVDNNTDEVYITEKIFNAFEYGTVPIYKGSKDIEKLVNTKAFINCNGKSTKEIIDIVKYYDTHDEEYYKMLQEPIFIGENNRDWKQYICEQLIDFYKNKVGLTSVD